MKAVRPTTPAGEELTDAHFRVLAALADEGTIDTPDARTTALLDDLVGAGLAIERKPRPGGTAVRGTFSPTARGRSLAARLP